MLYLALSCLQGRPMQAAFDALAVLADGVQLTPGNVPTPDFALHVARSGVPIRTHQGFCWYQRRRAVWDDAGRCVSGSMSVHPPRTGLDWLERMAREHAIWPLLEVMYPGWMLGDGAQVERAMELGVRLAVDVSHVYIQRTQGAMSSVTWRRLQAYDHVHEIHVSANDGRADTHRPLTPETFGLAWAQERAQSGCSVILESYFHRLDRGARQQQVALARGQGCRPQPTNSLKGVS